jgi:hypothetical protein
MYCLMITKDEENEDGADALSLLLISPFCRSSPLTLLSTEAEVQRNSIAHNLRVPASHYRKRINFRGPSYFRRLAYEIT